MKYTRSNLPSEIAATERGRQVLKTFIPDYEQYANVDFNPIGTFGQGYHPEGMPRDIADQIVRALNGPIESVIPQALSRKSLDEVDLESFQAGPSPLDGPAVEVELRPLDETPTFRFQNRLSFGWGMGLDGGFGQCAGLGSGHSCAGSGQRSYGPVPGRTPSGSLLWAQSGNRARSQL